MYVHEFPKNRSWNLDPIGDRFDQQQNETFPIGKPPDLTQNNSMQKYMVSLNSSLSDISFSR